VTPDAQARAVAEALADVLVERGLVIAAESRSPRRILDAAKVAEMLGRDRHWVYAHAPELGAFRFGDGPRARLGFDLVALERWKRARAREKNGRRPTRPPRPRARRDAGRGLIPYEPA
jgi:hypothetical protein